MSIQSEGRGILVEQITDWQYPLSSPLPQCLIASSPPLEYEQLLVTWNATQVDYPHDKCIHHLFEEQVERTPDACAVVFAQQRLSYRELNSRANQLAHYLQGSGVGPDMLVGISMECSLEMVVGILGILKAGGAYVPLDPTYPYERLAFMLADAGLTLLVTQQHLAEVLPTHEAHVIYLDANSEIIAQESEKNPTSGVTYQNLAYVIYTSGSTGRPKGVLVEHRGLGNMIKAQIRTFAVQSHSRVLQFASLSFDASVSEIFMTWLAGAQLHLIPSDLRWPAPVLLKFLREQAITTITLPPAVLAILSPDELPDLQTVISAGEELSSNIVEHWASGHRLLNAYGPTEGTVCTTISVCTDGSHKPTIGRPIANTQVYLLDTHLQSVSPGISAQMYIGGVGLARGYLNRPELTAEKFVPNPFSTEPGARLYKTGDLARYLPDGAIEYIGRIDRMVKVRGFRIELGEIEAILEQHPGLSKAVVLLHEDHHSDKRLIAYAIPHPDYQSSEKLLAAWYAEDGIQPEIPFGPFQCAESVRATY